mmetsp:Transcript_30718/g.99942  ORF Transcript_30718/g.99942 Transcript_30718/m.99942 type:complete len:364 (+) Transcript_30718:2056-3147(+)
MQPLAPTPTRHRAPRKLVNDDHLVAADDVVDIAELKLLRLEGVVDVERPLVARVVKVRDLQQFLRSLEALLREKHILALLVDGVMRVLLERVRDLCRLDVALGRLLSRARDDQRRACLVNQNAIHLIDDAKVELPQHELLRGLREVITQVVKTELRVGDIRDIGQVCVATVLLLHLRLHEPDRQSEEPMHLPNPFAVTLRQVVVHRHHVHALPRKRIQVCRQDSYERLALAGAHLRDFALVENEPADELYVERPEPQHAGRSLTRHRKRHRQEGVERRARGHLRLELVRLPAKLVVAQLLERRRERVDCGHLLLETLPRLVGGVAHHELLEAAEQARAGGGRLRRAGRTGAGAPRGAPEPLPG